MTLAPGARLGPYEILEPLNHPNIVTIHDVGVADGTSSRGDSAQGILWYAEVPAHGLMNTSSDDLHTCERINSPMMSRSSKPNS